MQDMLELEMIYIRNDQRVFSAQKKNSFIENVCKVLKCRIKAVLAITVEVQWLDTDGSFNAAVWNSRTKSHSC